MALRIVNDSIRSPEERMPLEGIAVIIVPALHDEIDDFAFHEIEGRDGRLNGFGGIEDPFRKLPLSAGNNSAKDAISGLSRPVDAAREIDVHIPWRGEPANYGELLTWMTAVCI